VKDILNPSRATCTSSRRSDGPLGREAVRRRRRAEEGPFSGVLAQGSIDAGDLIGSLRGEKLEVYWRTRRRQRLRQRHRPMASTAQHRVRATPAREIRGQIVKK